MNIVDKIFVGEVIQDFGIIEEESLGISRMRKSTMLVKQKGKIRFVIKTSTVAFLAASVNYAIFDLENAYKIRQSIDQSELIIKGLPYSENFSTTAIFKELPISAVFSAMVTFVLGTLIIWWLNSSVWVLLATLGLFLMLVNSFQDFHRYEAASDWQKILPALLAVFILFLGIGRFFLMNFG